MEVNDSHKEDDSIAFCSEKPVSVDIVANKVCQCFLCKHVAVTEEKYGKSSVITIMFIPFKKIFKHYIDVTFIFSALTIIHSLWQPAVL